MGFTRDDWGADLGGYILKDRLWFFAAYDRVTRTTQNELTTGPFEGDEVESRTVRNLGSGKLTWGFATGHTLVASVHPGPAHGQRRDRRRQPHSEWRVRHVSGASGLRRTGLLPAVGRPLRLVIRDVRAGRPPRGAQLDRPGERRGRHRRVHRRPRGQLPDRRVRPHPEEELPARPLCRFRNGLPSATRDQGRPGVREGQRRGRQEDVGRAAGHDLRERTRPGAADLPALLLDDGERDAFSIQRSDFPAEREPRARDLDGVPAGSLERPLQSHAEPRDPLGPAGNH